VTAYVRMPRTVQAEPAAQSLTVSIRLPGGRVVRQFR
jgi:hypothetical protein